MDGVAVEAGGSMKKQNEFIEEWADFAIAMLILVAAIAIAQII